MSEQNKLIKMVTDSAVLVGITAGVGYLAKKILKEKLSRRPVLKRYELCEIHWCSRGFYGAENLSGRSENTSKIYFKMASIAIMLGGAVLNASTFIGGSYLAKYLSGTKTDQERRRHDKALERYQRDYAKYQENRQKLLDWQEQTGMKMRYLHRISKILTRL